MSPANQIEALADKDQTQGPADGFDRAPGQSPGKKRPVITHLPGQETVPLKKKKSKALLLMVIAMALTFMGVIGAALYRKTHHAPGMVQKVAAMLGLESPPRADATPGSAPVLGTPVPKPLTTPAPPIQRSEYAQMQATVDQMQQAITSIQETLLGIRADSEATNYDLEKLSKSVYAQRHAAARRKQKVVAKVETHAPVSRPSANVLSVDSWDGRQSVSVSQGGQIKFIQEGDSLGGYVLKSADWRKQQAEFVTPEGQTRRVRASESGQ